MKNSIFRYPLTQSSRSIVFFIGLAGSLYGSQFWSQIFEDPDNYLLNFLERYRKYSH